MNKYLNLCKLKAECSCFWKIPIDIWYIINTNLKLWFLFLWGLQYDVEIIRFFIWIVGLLVRFFLCIDFFYTISFVYYLFTDFTHVSIGIFEHFPKYSSESALYFMSCLPYLLHQKLYYIFNTAVDIPDSYIILGKLITLNFN